MNRTAESLLGYYPPLEEFKGLSRHANLVPVYREIDGDLETPVSAYLKVARPPYSFLLESVEGGERMARYSFIGTEPLEVIKTGKGEALSNVDPLVPIEEALSGYTMADAPYLGKFNGGAVGYLSYEAATHFERLPTPDGDGLGLPESVMMLTTTFLEFDHLRHRIRVVSHGHVDGDVERAYFDAVGRIDEIVARLGEPLPSQARAGNGRLESWDVSSNVNRETYEENVERVKRYVVQGDVIQVVPSQRLARQTDAHPFQIYRALRNVNPSPYMYYLNLDDFQIVGASPEMLVQVVDGVVSTVPIAGTRPRGKTPAEDDDLERELSTDEKERAEHIMLLDLGRNDLGRVSKPGTVQVMDVMKVERYSHVMHLVSTVSGKLAAGCTAFDAMRACFPAGTVTGAPKIRAMEIIAELERDKRGVYAGAVGYFDLSGNMDTAIAIRTLVMKDGVAYAQAGGGVVYDSLPPAEYQETLDKAMASLRAIDLAEQRI